MNFQWNISVRKNDCLQFADMSGSEADFRPEDHFPQVIVLRSCLTLEKAHKMAPDELWEFHAKELLALYPRQSDTIKFLAVTNATR
jgi:hypothetical protein